MNGRALLLMVSSLLAALCPLVARADETVRQVQEELRKRSLYFGDIDGRDTPQLAAALRRYQERKGFDPTGEPDADTVRSFGLRSPVAVASSGKSQNVPLLSPISLPWPDVIVLKSDHSRRTAPPDVSKDFVDPTASPAPPPAAAAVQRSITPEQARDFIARYLQAGAKNDASAEAKFYGEKVDYFDEGVVKRPFIESDSRNYNRRWPTRQFSLHDPVKVTPTDDPSHVKVEFQYNFVVKGHNNTVQGRVATTYVLSGDQPENLKIIDVKERRVRE